MNILAAVIAAAGIALATFAAMNLVNNRRRYFILLLVALAIFALGVFNL